MFGSLKRAFTGAAREVSADLQGNKDFLEGVCAACALVAYADGSCSDEERQKILKTVAANRTLGPLYNAEQIERTASTMLTRAKDSSGRQELAVEMDEVKGHPQSSKMLDAIYLIAKDVANADGSIGPEETAVLAKIASRLGIDTSKFEF